MFGLSRLLLLVVVLTFSSVGFGSIVADAAGDFLTTYTGPKNPDMDVISAEVILDTVNSTLTFQGTMSGTVGTTPAPAVYFFGVNRGAGTSGFSSGTPVIGTGIIFDVTVQLRPDGSVQVNDRLSGTNTRLPDGSMTINNNTITTIALPLSLFPSNGFTPDNYTWNFWPRYGTGKNNQVADFVLDGASHAVSVVPEPLTLLLMGMGALCLKLKATSKNCF